MKRAQDEAMKQERRRSILEASRRLVRERGWEGFRLEDAAAALSLVKGTLYRYFPTRQDLLAELVCVEMEEWRRALEASLPTPAPGTWIAASLAGRELLVRLLTGLHMGIESGLSPEGLLGLKRLFAVFLEQGAALVEAQYPVLAGRGSAFLLEVYALMIGAAQLAWPPAPVAALIAGQADLAVFRIDFGAFLSAGVDRLYAGHAQGKAGCSEGKFDNPW